MPHASADRRPDLTGDPPADPAATGALDLHPGWPAGDPWPPREDTWMHPLVAAARRVAREMLEPAAARVDHSGVPRTHLDAMASVGLIGEPLATAPASVAREVTETLAGSCGSTWFVAAQHTTPYAMISTSDNSAVRERWLAGLASGGTHAGVVVAHLRRREPSVRAVPDGSHWHFEGVADWCTGWGVIDVVLVAAVSDPGDRYVFALLPAVAAADGGPPGLGASGPLRVAAMRGARTSKLFLDRVPVSRDDVVAVVARDAWHDADAARTARTTPATLGVLRRAVAALTDLGARRGDEATVRAAATLTDRARGLRERAYALADEPEGPPYAGSLRVRADVADATLRATSALIAARGGAALSDDDPASRWAREALFHLVQAQSGDVREATLARLTTGFTQTEGQ